MKNIYLIRHAETISNAGGVAVKNPDIPLTSAGEQQSIDVANWLIANVGNIDYVHVSKFIRTQQTAKPLLEKTQLKANILEGLEEFNYIDFKRIKGISATQRRELSAQYWLNAEPDFIDGGIASDAESFTHLQRRIQKVLSAFKDFPAANHVVYTHGLWLSAFLWQLLNMPTNNNADMQRFRQFEQSMAIENTAVFLLQIDKTKLPAIRKYR